MLYVILINFHVNNGSQVISHWSMRVPDQEVHVACQESDIWSVSLLSHEPARPTIHVIPWIALFNTKP